MPRVDMSKVNSRAMTKLLLFTGDNEFNMEHQEGGGRNTDALYYLIYLAAKYNNECVILDREGRRLKFNWDKRNHRFIKWSIPNNFFDKIKKCNNKITIIRLTLHFTDGHKHNLHANILIINPINKTITHFEPHGFSYLGTGEFDKFNGEIEQSIIKLFKPLNLKYITRKQVCGRWGFQAIEEQAEPKEKTGKCADWSMFYVDASLQYPDAKPGDINAFVRRTLNDDPDTFRAFIRGYIRNRINEREKFILWVKTVKKPFWLKIWKNMTLFVMEKKYLNEYIEEKIKLIN